MNIEERLYASFFIMSSSSSSLMFSLVDSARIYHLKPFLLPYASLAFLLRVELIKSDVASSIFCQQFPLSRLRSLRYICLTKFCSKQCAIVVFMPAVVSLLKWYHYWLIIFCLHLTSMESLAASLNRVRPKYLKPKLVCYAVGHLNL